jgi:hypothetical protein
MPRPRLTDLDILAEPTYGLTHRPIPARVLRAVDHGVAVEHGRGIVIAARVRAMEHVADEALHAAGHLSQSEAFWTRQAPHGAARYQAIADLAAMALADIVAEMGRQ